MLWRPSTIRRPRAAQDYAMAQPGPLNALAVVAHCDAAGVLPWDRASCAYTLSQPSPGRSALHSRPVSASWLDLPGGRPKGGGRARPQSWDPWSGLAGNRVWFPPLFWLPPAVPARWWHLEHPVAEVVPGASDPSMLASSPRRTNSRGVSAPRRLPVRSPWLLHPFTSPPSTAVWHMLRRLDERP